MTPKKLVVANTVYNQNHHFLEKAQMELAVLNRDLLGAQQEISELESLCQEAQTRRDEYLEYVDKEIGVVDRSTEVLRRSERALTVAESKKRVADAKLELGKAVIKYQKDRITKVSFELEGLRTWEDAHEPMS